MAGGIAKNGTGGGKGARAGKGASRAAGPGAAKSAGAKMPRPERISIAAGHIQKSLDDIEKARQAIEGHFREAAESNLERAHDAVDILSKAARVGPLLDVRGLEKDMALLVDASGELRARKGKGRKRDVWAVDGLLGDAARRLEGAVAGATARNLGLLTERLTELGELRNELQGKVNERFRARLDSSRRVLALLVSKGAAIGPQGQEAVARELDEIAALGRKCHPGNLGGKLDDLYTIDRFVKQVARRLEKVAAIMAAGTGGPKG